MEPLLSQEALHVQGKPRVQWANRKGVREFQVGGLVGLKQVASMFLIDPKAQELEQSVREAVVERARINEETIRRALREGCYVTDTGKMYPTDGLVTPEEILHTPVPEVIAAKGIAHFGNAEKLKRGEEPLGGSKEGVWFAPPGFVSLLSLRTLRDGGVVLQYILPNGGLDDLDHNFVYAFGRAVERDFAEAGVPQLISATNIARQSLVSIAHDNMRIPQPTGQ